jgi:hypothetical protein
MYCFDKAEEKARELFVDGYGENPDDFEEKYQGWFRDIAEYVATLVDQGIVEVPVHLLGYFDAEKYGRDLCLNGEIWTDNVEGGIVVFWS